VTAKGESRTNRIFGGESIKSSYHCLNAKSNYCTDDSEGFLTSKNKDQNHDDFDFASCELVSSTPVHTPFEKKIVSRSTGVKNPYMRKRSLFRFSSIAASQVTPVPLVLNQRSVYVTPSTGNMSYRNLNFLKKVNVKFDVPVPKVLNYGEPIHKPQSFKFIIGGQKISLKKFASIYGPMNRSRFINIDSRALSVILDVTPCNSARVRFDKKGLPVGFSGRIDPHQKVRGCIKDLRLALLHHGCSASLLVDIWISNHFRWIVWKLASMERKFPHVLGGIYLSFSHVVHQMKYRFDREICEGVRPVLRKVLNRDLAASTMMILLVTKIIFPNTGTTSKQKEIRCELSDGWYSVPGIPDIYIQRFISEGKIKVGSKILVCNAILEGVDDGIDPLDYHYQSLMARFHVRLKFFANSTRVCKWNSKLGLVLPTIQTKSFGGTLGIKRLKDVIPGGGFIPSINLVVCKAYPILFMEANDSSKIVSNRTTLTESENSRRQGDFEKRKQKFVERITEEVRQKIIEEIDESAPEIWRAMDASINPSDFHTQLSEDQQNEIDRWYNRRLTLINDEMHRAVTKSFSSERNMQRQSTRFIRFLVRSWVTKNDLISKGRDIKDEGILTIWEPSQGQIEMLKEGSLIQFHNLDVKASSNSDQKQLSARRSTIMQKSNNSPSEEDLKTSGYSKRKYLPLLRVHLKSKKLGNESISCPELDCAGYLLDLKETKIEVGMRLLIYLTDITGLVLRIEYDGCALSDFTHRHKLKPEAQKSTLLLFRDLRVCPFDRLEGCARAIWTQSTTFIFRVNHNLSSIADIPAPPPEEDIYERLSLQLRTGIPMNLKLPISIRLVFGYAVNILPRQKALMNYTMISTHYLKVVIDSGLIIEASLPTHLVSNFLQMYSIDANIVSTLMNPESNINELFDCAQHLSQKLKYKSTLLRFVLQSVIKENDNVFEVIDISLTDVKALSGLHLIGKSS